jgi:hypothetical protein
MPISAALYKHLDADRHLFACVCVKVPEVPAGTLHVFCLYGEASYTRTEILSLFCPLLVLIVPQCISRSKALFYIWRCVQSLQWGVSTSTSLQPGGPPLVGCPQLLVQYICSCPPYQKAVRLFELWRRAILWSVTFGEKRKLMSSYNMSGCWRRERQGNRGLQQTA